MTGRRPPVRALRFDPGRNYTIHLKDGHVVTGRCSMSNPTEVWLVHPHGTWIVQWSGIARIENHDARR